ncbi:restriction endonuclease subunit S [Streptomyces malaysiensis]|uniref:restriction endonuclease subunit S n=1 Tax=Streptomyces malaysiensis TaxID=92644 RepID=UPI002B324297|nr:restriction endonuclease subunit S [Streptomyces malaysiensis]
MVPNGWRTLPLEAVVKLKRGFDLPASKRVNGDVPVVGSAGISGWHNEVMVKGPGVVVGRAGAMGVATYVRQDFWPLNTSLFVEDFCGNDPRFIYSLLHCLDFSGYNSGAAQPMLNRNYIKAIRVILPDRLEQRAIAEVLGALDDKIAVNEQMAETGISLGRALLGEQLQGMTSEVPLGEVADLIYGKALPASQRRNGVTPVFGCTGQVGWHDVPLTATGCPVVGRKGANAGHVSWMSNPGWVIDTAFYAKPVSSMITHEVLYFLLESASIDALAADSAIPGVNRNVALRHRILIPGLENLRRFGDRARELLTVSVQAETESRTLAELRDTLLPKLISGQIRIKDAERAVEEVV